MAAGYLTTYTLPCRRPWRRTRRVVVSTFTRRPGAITRMRCATLSSGAHRRGASHSNALLRFSHSLTPPYTPHTTCPPLLTLSHPHTPPSPFNPLRRCADNFDHWQRVPCVDGQGERVSKPQLAETLYASLRSEFVNQKVVAAPK